MASLTFEQLTMMLKTINDAAQANSVAIASLTQSQQAVTQSQQAAERAWQVAHEELHSRVHQLQTEMRSVPTSGTSTHHRSLIDPKTLMPDAFSGEPKSQSWRDWSYRLKSFIGSMHPKLQNAMERAEHKVTPVSDTEFAQLAIDPAVVNDLKALLTQKTNGYAHTIIRQHDMSNGLEMYRCLAQHFEPDTEARNLDDLRQILHPAAATSIDDFSRKFPAWKALYQTRLNRIGQAAVLPDDIRLTLWIDMLPPRERDDVTRHRHFWKDSDALDRHLLQLIADRARGNPTSLAYMEQEEYDDDLEFVLNEETGETYLCRVEPKTGKRTFVKTRRFGAPSRPMKCYRCGRTGHISTDCHAKTHVDGGAPRPKPPPRQVNSVEEDAVNIHSRPTVPQYPSTDASNPQELGICDICGVEEEEDPWNKKDPWMSPGLALGAAAAEAVGGVAGESAPAGHSGQFCRSTAVIPSLWNPTVCCSLCTKEGVYERHNQKIMAVVNTSGSPGKCGANALFPPERLEIDTSGSPGKCGANALFHPERLEIDICAISLDKTVSGRRLSADITVDSGAGKSVMNADAVPEYAMQESPGQLQGQHFLGAGGERLPNLGQKCVPLMTADGVSRLATFQIAPVRKPLMAVSASCDAGQLCLFDNDGSYVIERESSEGREIRRLAKMCIRKMALERKNGVYVLPTWVTPPEHLSPETRRRTKPVNHHRPTSSNDMEVDSVFARQGR